LSFTTRKGNAGWASRLQEVRFLTSCNLEAQPGLPFRVVKLNVASGQVCDSNGRDHRFVSNVLQSLELQVDLNLRLCSSGTKKNTET